tara:strand:- start:231 stop:509 length:279 start_codon:yes stop_codon:yes gene_type:complete
MTAASAASMELALSASSACVDVARGEWGGSMGVAVFFLFVFIALLAGDGVLTAFALTSAMNRDDAEIKKRRVELKRLNDEIAARRSVIVSMR